MILRLILSAIFGVVVIAAYVAGLHGLSWVLDKHPWALIIGIVLVGLPVGYYATRYANREAQKRSIWSGLGERVSQYGFVISESEQERGAMGAALIDDVFFGMVTILVTERGIRLDRPFVDVRPISISWSEVQRIDRCTFLIKNKPESAASIWTRHSDVQLVVAPWKGDQHERVPDQVGVTAVSYPELPKIPDKN